MNAPAAPLAPGAVLAGTYEIERLLGRGGMGEVWLARHLRLAGKQVAIKVLHVDRALPQEALARFRREAEIAARLEHPNIVQVLDFNTLPSGQPYLVMEYLKGQSLAARAQGQPLPLDQLFVLMRQVGAALQAAHHAGVVHRDLKPENIFLVPTAAGDQVKVLDFGISKLSDSNSVQTTDSTLIGTPLYMSPEQALGNNREVGPQSDLFSLGSILFELLAGRAPFFAESVARVVFRIAYEQAPSLRELRPDLPEHVLRAVGHALERERERRTPTIEALVEELTGQPLVTVAHDPAGLYRTGLSVTPSMISGQTRAPSTPPGTVTAPSGPLVSGKLVVGIILGLTVAIAGVVTRVRMANWAEREEYRSSMRDAGWVMLEDGNFVQPDAGPAPAALTEDAGQASAEDAGVVPTVVDAGATPEGPQTPRPAAPPTAAERATLDALTAELRDHRWEQVWASRNVVFELHTPRALEEGYGLLFESACQRHDNAGLLSLLPNYRRFATGAQRSTHKRRCVELYPSAADLDW